MNFSRVLQDHMDTRSSTLVGRASLIEAVLSTDFCSSSFSGMYGIGGFTRPLPCSHSCGFSLSGTALLILVFMRAIPREVPTNKALKKLLGAPWRSDVMVGLDPCSGIGTHCLSWCSSRKIVVLLWCVWVVCRIATWTWEGRASLRLSADSDISRFGNKKLLTRKCR